MTREVELELEIARLREALESLNYDKHWIRIPAQDIEIEVPEGV